MYHNTVCLVLGQRTSVGTSGAWGRATGTGRRPAIPPSRTKVFAFRQNGPGTRCVAIFIFVWLVFSRDDRITSRHVPCAISNKGGKGTLYDDDDATLLCAPTTSLISRACASTIQAHYIVGLVWGDTAGGEARADRCSGICKITSLIHHGQLLGGSPSPRSLDYYVCTPYCLWRHATPSSFVEDPQEEPDVLSSEVLPIREELAAIAVGSLPR